MGDILALFTTTMDGVGITSISGYTRLLLLPSYQYTLSHRKGVATVWSAMVTLRLMNLCGCVEIG